jgi:MerR family copper efflux transcriptional regulator
MLKIGELAKAAGVKLTTVRFYERYGLIPEPNRTDSGYRQYLPSAVTRIRFIKNAQEFGFSLDEIVELLDIKNNIDLERNVIKSKIADKITVMEGKIRELVAVRNALQELHDCCPGDGAIDQGCPIIDALYACKCKN